jgi:hypothetical protein
LQPPIGAELISACGTTASPSAGGASGAASGVSGAAGAANGAGGAANGGAGNPSAANAGSGGLSMANGIGGAGDIAGAGMPGASGISAANGGVSANGGASGGAGGNALAGAGMSSAYAGASGSATTSGGAGGASSGGTTPTQPVFCDQLVWNQAPVPANRTLYSWTTAEQVAELRADPSVLLTRSETPDLGRGYAFTSIDTLAARGTAPENALLEKISNELFVKVRYAWPNAWATRMGWPGEDYGDQLLRIVLKPEAWIVVVYDGSGMAVIDTNNQLVSIADAVAHSERIAAVYFYKQEITGNGSFHVCSGGYREFIVGNEAMIEEWSLGTEDIRDRILADAALIDAFFADIRATPPTVDPSSFNEDVVCNWDAAPSGEVEFYERALSIPSEYYMPLPQELANLSQTLRASVFEPDPLVVRPGE